MQISLHLKANKDLESIFVPAISMLSTTKLQIKYFFMFTFNFFFSSKVNSFHYFQYFDLKCNWDFTLYFYIIDDKLNQGHIDLSLYIIDKFYSVYFRSGSICQQNGRIFPLYFQYNLKRSRTLLLQRQFKGQTISKPKYFLLYIWTLCYLLQ